MHPGAVSTNIPQDMSWCVVQLYTAFSPFFYFFLKSPQEGAYTSVYVAVAPHLEDMYYSDCIPGRVDPIGKDPVMASTLWKRSCTVVGLDDKKIQLTP